MKKNNRISRIVILALVLILFLLFKTDLKKVLPVPASQQNRLQIVFFNVGQGDSMLVIFPNSRTLLIDAGSGRNKYVDFDAGEMVLAPYFEKKRISCLDGVVLTHPHSDHLGGLIYILEHYKVRNIFDAGLKTNTLLYKKYLQLIALKKIKYRALFQGDEILLDRSVKVQVLSPPENYPGVNDLNNRSLVIKIIYKKISVLLAADIREKTEQKLVKQNIDLKASVLKVPHHGDINSFSELFIKAAAPQAAVISMGKSNKFNEDISLALRQFRDNNVKVYRTDKNGRIEFITDGSSYQFRTIR